MSLVDHDLYSSQCPIGDRDSTFEHYLQSCIASRQWRTQLYHNRYSDWERFPTVEELLHHETPAILSLLDHSALGTPTFVQNRDTPF